MYLCSFSAIANSYFWTVNLRSCLKGPHESLEFFCTMLCVETETFQGAVIGQHVSILSQFLR